jgi:hypothetical protein
MKKTANEKICFDEIVVCLFDGDYDLGTAVLVNSLVKSKFKGLIYIGYRGVLPEWVEQLNYLGESLYRVNADITLCFKQIEPGMHLGYYKPYFLKEAFDRFSSTNKIFYFDADIVVKASWKIFSNWLDKGICLCLDNSFHFLHYSHPWRKQWRQLAPTHTADFNDLNYYFNSGFIGIERGSIAVLDRWIYYTEKYIEIGGNIDRFVKDEYTHLKGDQDLLNAAITISPEVEISIIGREGMGFTSPSAIMDHAVGEVKPWNSRFFRQLVKFGRKPSFAEKSFFSHCEFPIAVFPGYKFQIKKIDLFVASFFGRIIG